MIIEFYYLSSRKLVYLYLNLFYYLNVVKIQSNGTLNLCLALAVGHNEIVLGAYHLLPVEVKLGSLVSPNRGHQYRSIANL